MTAIRCAAMLLVIGAMVVPAAVRAEPAQHEATMALPVVGLAFGLGYLADDLKLWEKHGVRMKSVQISGIGAMNSVIAGSTDFTQSSGSAITRAARAGSGCSASSAPSTGRVCR